jgi:hypothetical protein
MQRNYLVTSSRREIACQNSGTRNRKAERARNIQNRGKITVKFS